MGGKISQILRNPQGNANQCKVMNTYENLSHGNSRFLARVSTKPASRSSFRTGIRLPCGNTNNRDEGGPDSGSPIA